MRESNWIEGERNKNANPLIGDLHPNDIEAMGVMHSLAMEGRPPRKETLCIIHGLLAEHRNDLREKGEYRTIDVTVGGRRGTSPDDIHNEMEEFFSEFTGMSAWRAHAEYEMIHPFEDLNGRTGRILWAWCHLLNGKNPFRLPFLQAYYYETLSHYRV